MYEENKVINFTTQNSFLHYGVKGMKWGVINEDPYMPVARRRRNGQVEYASASTVRREQANKGRLKKAKPIKKRGNGLGLSNPVGPSGKNGYQKNKVTGKEFVNAENVNPYDVDPQAFNEWAEAYTGGPEALGQYLETQYQNSGEPEMYQEMGRRAKQFDDACSSMNSAISNINNLQNQGYKAQKEYFKKNKAQLQKSIDDFLLSLDYGAGAARESFYQDYSYCKADTFDDFVNFSNNIYCYLTGTAEGWNLLHQNGFNTGTLPCPQETIEDVEYKKITKGKDTESDSPEKESNKKESNKKEGPINKQYEEAKGLDKAKHYAAYKAGSAYAKAASAYDKWDSSMSDMMDAHIAKKMAKKKEKKRRKK